MMGMEDRVQRQSHAHSSGIRRVAVNEAPVDVRMAVASYETRHSAQFATATIFESSFLARLHGPLTATEDASSVPVRTVAANNRDVARAMDTLTHVANVPGKDMASRRSYLAALHVLFQALPVDSRQLASLPSTLCVAPEREGRQLASSLGYLALNRSLTPNAKRIPYPGGLLVALTTCCPIVATSECLIVDGVIATGATIITIIDHLRVGIERFRVVCAHSTPAGVRALQRYALDTGVEIEIHAAIVSGTLNTKYYATDATNPDVVLLGDVGDTITNVKLAPSDAHAAPDDGSALSESSQSL
jgi:hypothetical protein